MSTLLMATVAVAGDLGAQAATANRAIQPRLDAGQLHRRVGTRQQLCLPLLESLHFVGMALLIGIVGAIDLRVLGVARAILWHRCIASCRWPSLALA
jgi:hypothetical protein